MRRSATTGSATATIDADQAAIEIAQLNLDYTRIRSPIDGKTGPMLVQPGNMVAANKSTAPLVTINQIQPIKVSFALPQSDLPRIQTRAAQGGLMRDIDQRDQGGRPYSGAGRLRQQPRRQRERHDRAARDVRQRRCVARAGPARGRRPSSSATFRGATVVPREAVNAGPDDLYVYVVTADNRAAQRP